MNVHLSRVGDIMPIILKCRDVSGSVAFPSGMVEGLPQPERRYAIVDNLVTLSGYPDAVLRHDMLELLSMPEGLYRMLTPQEQNVLAAQAQAAISVTEQAPVKSKQKSSENGG